MKYTIDDLKNTKCAVINDGTIEELNKVLTLAFPNDTTHGQLCNIIIK